MKKIISLNIVLLVVGLFTLMTALLLVVTSYSIINVVLTAAFVAWTATIPFLIHWNDRVEARWPWMKSTWFVFAYRAVAVSAIAIAMFVMLSD